MSRKDEGRGTRCLIDHVVGAVELGPPRALLATTFDLSADFFEHDFLPSILRLPALDDRRARSRIALEGQLGAMDAVAVLMEARRFRGRPQSLRVDLRPSSLRSFGVLHAKVTLLVHDDAVRLLVASANLTSSGYRENREVALTLTVNRKNVEAGALVRQALAPMPVLLGPWWSPAAATVHKAALRRLDELRAPAEAEGAAFVWGGENEPLWQRVLQSWPADEPVRSIRIVSPFWSDEIKDGPIAQWLGALKAKGGLASNAELLLITAAEAESRTSHRPILPASYGTFDFQALGVTARAIPAKPLVDEEDVGRDDLLRERVLHAKVLLLEGPRSTLAYVGSANFTSPGWGFGPTANIEAGVVLVRRGKARSELAALIPPTTGDATPLNGRNAGRIAVPVSDDEAAPFPTFVESVELQPSARDRDALDLLVLISPNRAPAEWGIALKPDGASTFLGHSGSPRFSFALSPEQLSEVLRRKVVWFAWPPGEGLAVAYPVNVAPEARTNLPFGDPDALPGEHDLVAFYQGRISFEDAFPSPAEDRDESTDGTITTLASAVDTSKILSYQVRNFVEALSGIREELRNSAKGEATIRLAFQGPVSPLALARHIVKAFLEGGRSATAAAFQLVELLACIREVAQLEVSEPLAGVWVQTCGEAQRELLALLMKVQAGAGSSLDTAAHFDRYVRAVVGDVREGVAE